MRHRGLLSLALGLLVGLTFATPRSEASTTTPLLSDDIYTVGEGDLELDLLFDTQIIRGDIDDTQVRFRLGGNYFVNDWIAPGLEFEVADDNGTTFRFLPNVKLYWQLYRRILPYFQVGIGYAHIPGGFDLFNFALGPGIKFLLSNTVALGFQFRYDLGVGDGTIHDISFPFAFAVFFRI